LLLSSKGSEAIATHRPVELSCECGEEVTDGESGYQMIERGQERKYEWLFSIHSRLSDLVLNGSYCFARFDLILMGSTFVRLEKSYR
jgi:hypothetical protein